MKISTILDQIDLGAMALPEFQRGYVWNRSQVRDLMTSLYHRHPAGGLLVWVTKTEHAKARSDKSLQAGSVELILDGQQRIPYIVVWPDSSEQVSLDQRHPAPCVHKG